MAKILVVDDDLMIRVILKHTLEEHEVLMAEDGRQAIALVEWEQPDLVLMDILMPGLDGITTAQVIATRHSLPIILMSELADDVVVPFGLSPVKVVQKPFDPIELRKTVSIAISNALLKRASMPARLACS
ncbi:MAG: response regulator [Candidatus Obscuribacterales bacterium]|nr:response regulator [Candidatus Obscuribacterales bacterium]